MYHYAFSAAFDRSMEYLLKELDKKPDLITDQFRGTYLGVPIVPQENFELSVSSIANARRKKCGRHDRADEPGLVRPLGHRRTRIVFGQGSHFPLSGSEAAGPQSKPAVDSRDLESGHGHPRGQRERDRDQARQTIKNR